MSLLASVQGLSASFASQDLHGASPAEQAARDALSRLRNRATDDVQPFPGDPAQTAVADRSRETPAAFANVLGDLVTEVDAKRKAAGQEVHKVMTGESENLHQAMIAMQESGVAFDLMIEVRNKLVEAYQTLIRVPSG